MQTMEESLFLSAKDEGGRNLICRARACVRKLGVLAFLVGIWPLTNSIGGSSSDVEDHGAVAMLFSDPAVQVFESPV
jgi:hypothetical protein